MKFLGQNGKRLVVLGIVWVLGCSPADEETNVTNPSVEMDEATATTIGDESAIRIVVPQELQAGEERFNALCARCHGVHAKGTNAGPPFVHKIYEPSHHGDFSFIRAAAQGVRAHHWKFGDMPKISDASAEDVEQIVPYVRWLQREAGIY